MENLQRVLITGATGFIGSHLTRKLVKEGFEVGIIKRKNSNLWRICDLINKLSIYDADLRNINKVSEVISHFKPDVIFHLVTYYAIEHKLQEISLMVDTNVLGTINLLEASKKFSVKLFVNTSSCFVYQESKNKLRENSKLIPLSLYALTKIQAEQACSFYTEKYGLRTITFRLFPPYGPADHERRLIPYTIKSFFEEKKLKLTTGKQRWDFVYVDDIINAYLKLLNKYNLPITHEILNIGTGNAISVQEVISRTKEIIGSDIKLEWGVVPHRKNEVWFLCADINKAKDFLKWEPKTQILQKGLESTVNWYRKLWREEKNGKNN